MSVFTAETALHKISGKLAKVLTDDQIRRPLLFISTTRRWNGRCWPRPKWQPRSGDRRNWARSAVLLKVRRLNA